MQEIQCVAHENYNGAVCRVFLDGEDFYMTYTDVGKAIGFEVPYLTVLKICEKHKAVFRGLCFKRDVSKWTNADSAEMLLSSEGIIELCVLADRPEADDFVDFLWRMMEKTKKIMEAIGQDDDEFDDDDDDDCGCDANCCQIGFGFCDGNCPQPFDLDSLCDEYDDDDDDELDNALDDDDDLDDDVDTAIRNMIRESNGIRAHAARADYKKAELLIQMANSNRVSYEQGKLLIDLALAECFGGKMPDSLKDKWTQVKDFDFEW